MSEPCLIGIRWENYLNALDLMPVIASCKKKKSVSTWVHSSFPIRAGAENTHDCCRVILPRMNANYTLSH